MTVERVAAARTDTSALALFSMLVIYAVARSLPLFSDKFPVSVIAALHIISPLVFAYFHGAKLFGRRAILIFFFLFLLLGNIVENVGVLTGFPFGEYYFTDRMGPKLFHVPVLLGLAYLGMGYVCWTLAFFIIGKPTERDSVTGFTVIALPLTASFLMVAWDISQDAVWSTIEHCWIWVRGGSYFGVPISNFFGWFLTAYAVYQVFALYLRRTGATLKQLPISFRYLAILLYVVSAAGNILLCWRFAPGGVSVIADASGTLWNVRDILNASAVTSIFTMGTLAVIAWIRVATEAKSAASR